MKKIGIIKKEIDLEIGGDILNHIRVSAYGANAIGKSFIGI